MPLRDVEPYHEWLDRNPSDAARRVVDDFLLRAADEPYTYPSVPDPDLSTPPIFEIRSALLPVPAEPPVKIYYRREFATEAVDLLGFPRGPDLR